MADEIVTEEVTDVADIATTETKVDTQPAQKIKGHITYEKWVEMGKDPEEYKGSKAFEKDGALFEALEAQNKRFKVIEDRYNKLAEMYHEADKKGYERGMQELKEQQKLAAQVGDYETVNNLTDQMLKLNKPTATTEIPVVKPGDEHIDAFIKRNPWYIDDTNPTTMEMKLYANYLDHELHHKHPYRSTREHLLDVEQKVKEKYASFFGTTPKASMAAVERTSDIADAPVSKGKDLYNDLPADQKRMFNDLKKRYPSISIEQYHADYKSIAKQNI